MKDRKFYDQTLQEIYRTNPWKILCCCVMLNRANRAQVDTVREELFQRWPTPPAMAEANTEELVEVLRPLGFYNRRAKTLKNMSKAFTQPFERVDQLPGIGKYAFDSWKIFVENRTDVDPEDEVLKQYLSKMSSKNCILRIQNIMEEK